MIHGLILSGGTGSRINSDIPKQYINVGGRSILSYSVETLSVCKDIDSIVIVADECWHKTILEDVHHFDVNHKFVDFAKPGDNRQLSILSGLKAIDGGSEDDWVLVHDAARPCLTTDDISGIVNVREGHDGVMPVLPMKDTVYISADGSSISSLIDRSTVFAGQAPELFRYQMYLEAHEANMEKIMSINGSSEIAVMAGMDIAIIPGNEGNYKITTDGDLERFKASIG